MVIGYKSYTATDANSDYMSGPGKVFGIGENTTSMKPRYVIETDRWHVDIGGLVARAFASEKEALGFIEDVRSGKVSATGLTEQSPIDEFCRMFEHKKATQPLNSIAIQQAKNSCDMEFEQYRKKMTGQIQSLSTNPAEAIEKLCKDLGVWYTRTEENKPNLACIKFEISIKVVK